MKKSITIRCLQKIIELPVGGNLYTYVFDGFCCRKEIGDGFGTVIDHLQVRFDDPVAFDPGKEYVLTISEKGEAT